MTPGQLRKALEAWRVGDTATLRRVMGDNDPRWSGPEWSPADHIQAQSRMTRARHEFDIELKRNSDGSFG